MADLKISALTSATTPLDGTEVLPVVQSGTTTKVTVANLTAGRAVSAASLALTASPLPVASGGTNASSAGITAFNNITGYTASGATGTTSTNLVFSTSPVLTTPDIGNAAGTNLTLGTATQKASLPGWRYYSEGVGYDVIVCTNSGGFAKYIAHTNTGAQNYVSFFVGLGSTNVNTGSITTNGTTTAYNTLSDYRLKNDVQPMQGALAKVLQLKPCTYKWKSNGSDGQGFLAHELQSVVPECVTGDKDATEIVDVVDENGSVIGNQTRPAYQAIDTSFLIATLVASIQELKTEFDAYKAAQAAQIPA